MLCLPGLKGLPLVGNLPLELRQPLATLIKAAREGGDVVRIGIDPGSVDTRTLRGAAPREGVRSAEDQAAVPSGVQGVGGRPDGPLLRGEEWPVPKIAREIALAPETLRSWVHTVRVDADEREGLTTEERVRSCAGSGAR